MKPSLSLRNFLLGSSLLAAVTTVNAADGTWNADADTTWNTAGNWVSNAIATGADSTAFFTNDITANRIVTLGANRIIGNITFSDNNGNLTIGDTALGATNNTLTLDVTGIGASPVVNASRQLSMNALLAGNDGMTKTGAGTMFFGNIQHTITGSLRISEGSIGASNYDLIDTFSDYTFDGGRLRITNGVAHTINRALNVTVNGGEINKGTADVDFHTYTGTFTSTGAGARTLTLSADTGTFARMQTVMSDSTDPSGGALSINKTGTGGTWNLDAANTHTGSTTITDGNLVLQNVNALQNSYINTTGSITGTTTAGLKITGTALNIGGLSGTKALASIFDTDDGGYGSITAITLNTAAANSIDYSGAITGSRSLTKSGDGKQTLSGVNTYTGATNVNGGTLEIGVGGSTHASSAVTVSNSGSALIVNGTVNGSLTMNASTTLSGSGTIVGAAIVSGNLNPGNSPGTMVYEDTLTMANSTVTTMEIDGQAGAGVTGGHDFINLTGLLTAGVLTYDGTLTLDMGTIFGAGTYSWSLFDFASETGTFDSITLADQYAGTLLDGNTDGIWDLASGNNTWTFTESTGELGLSVIPEPSTALLGGLGLLVLLRRRRKE